MTDIVLPPLPEPELLYYRPSFVEGQSIEIRGHTTLTLLNYAAAVSAADNKALREALQRIVDEQDERQGYASIEAYDAARAALKEQT